MEEEENDSKEVNRFEPFGKESLYKKYAERKVSNKIDEVLQKGEMDLKMKDKYIESDKDISSVPKTYSQDSDSIEETYEPYTDSDQTPTDYKEKTGQFNNDYLNKTNAERLENQKSSNEQIIDEFEQDISSTEINDEELGLTSEELNQLKKEESVKSPSQVNGYDSGKFKLFYENRF